jgi:hypothetical protein
MRLLFWITALTIGTAPFVTASAAPAVSSQSAATKAPFGCEARGGEVCHFQIFYQGGRGRVVVLPAGMKESIPAVRIGSDSYCVGINRRPTHKCARKVINANYNY